MNLLFLLQIDKQNLLEVKLIESAEIDVGPIDNEDAVRFEPQGGATDVADAQMVEPLEF